MPQIISISILGVTYTLTFSWRDAPDGGWVLDIGDAQNNPILNGIPLVTGADLLAQYAYKGLGIQLFVQTTDDPDAVPTFENFGTTANIYFLAA